MYFCRPPCLVVTSCNHMIYEVKVFLLGESDFQESTRSAAWQGKCESIMQSENMFNNFSMAVGHGIHSMSLQDIR